LKSSLSKRTVQPEKKAGSGVCHSVRSNSSRSGSSALWTSGEWKAPLTGSEMEEIENLVAAAHNEPDVDQSRALRHLSQLILQLKPLDRQIMLSYLEELDTASIAEITGLSASCVAMKVHRIKGILAARFNKDLHHV
jgi:DNA-directed RNA polymerase specialized sigma24 family protein